MSCRDFELWLVSDDPVERESAARHAAGCEACAGTLAGHERVLEHAAAWRGAHEAPAGLEDRIRLALEGAPRESVNDDEASEPAGRLLAWRRRPPARLALPAALAASLLTALVLGWSLFQGPTAPEVTHRLLAAEALEAARSAEKEHARAIARLEVAAAPLLARADQPDTDPEDVGRLLALADRLAFLDSTIEQVEAFVEDNPSHPQARTTLLAAYREKTEILSEVLALETTS